MRRLLGGLRRLFRGSARGGEAGRGLVVAELSGPDRGLFSEASGGDWAASYRPAPEEGSCLELRIDRGRLFAWTEAPGLELDDFVAEAGIAILPGSGYSAAGLLFRYADEANFYALLVSTRGYFRLDALFNGTPRTVLAWTELPALAAGAAAAASAGGAAGAGGAGLEFSLRVIARGPRITVMVDDLWAAELEDPSFRSGLFAFAAQTYGSDGTEGGPGEATGPDGARFLLRSFFAEGRVSRVEAWHSRYSYLVAPEPAAMRRVAESFLAMGEWLAAAVEFRKIERRRPLEAQELFLRAEAELRLELLDDAEASLDACLALEPGRADALLEKANLLYLRGKSAELRDFVLAARREGAAAGAGVDAGLPGRLALLLGHARFGLGDFAGAAEAYAEAAALEPGQPLLRMNEARAREQAGEADRAVEAYLAAARGFYEAEADADLELALGRLAALAPRRTEVQGLRAKALFRSGRKEEAVRLIEALVARGSPDSALHYLSGLVHAEKGRRHAAIERFRRALELEGDSALYAFRLAENLELALEEGGEAGGHARGAKGKARAAHRDQGPLPAPEEVDAAIARALELGPSDGWILNLAGARLLRSEALREGDPGVRAKARDYLLAACAALPGAPEPAINLAELESLEGAREVALTRLEAFPEDAAARNQAGNILAAAATAGRDSSGPEPECLERAAREYEAARRLDPSKAAYHCNLAACLLELGRYSEAETAIGKALELGGDARSLLVAGNIATVFGDRPRAEVAWRLGLERSPGDPALLLALGRSRLGALDAKGAEKYRAELETADPGRASLLGAEILAATTVLTACASCGRSWRSPRILPAQSPSSVRAMPPDDSPAGACPSCGKTYCIACRKADLAGSRFTCPDCGETLKLSDDRLRYLVREHLRRAARGG